MNKYDGNFNSRNDVAAQFEEGVGKSWEPENFKPVEGFPTDDEFIYATYDIDGYEGYAFALFERDSKLYEAHGSHCSCYGLEGQWSPEETTWEALAMRQPSSYGCPKVVVELAKSKQLEFK